MIRVVCGCGRVFRAEDRHTGKRTRCPVCGATLIIGQMSTSGSDEAELDEVPSWWYPSDAPGAIGAESARPGGYGDPEAMPTAILVPTPGEEGGRSAGLRDSGRRAHPASAGAGRLVRTLAGVLAAAVALGLGALCWMWWAVLIPGAVTATGAPRLGAVPGAAGRGPGPAGSPDPKGRLSVEDGSSGASNRGSEEGRPARPARRLRLLVPAYFYPTADGRLQWRRLFDAAAKVDLVAVVNPSSGPGAERNPDYATIIAEAADRGVKLVGYINTDYAARPASEIKGEVDAWVRFYPRIAGFFLDQQPADARHAAYVADIGTYARGKLKDALVITNPGVPCDESYLARRAADLVCLFSNFEGFASFELPAHLRPFEPSRHAALVYQIADAEAMRSLLKEAIIKRIGWIYVTDGKPPNPWIRLPPYWEAEVDAVMDLQ